MDRLHRLVELRLHATAPNGIVVRHDGRPLLASHRSATGLPALERFTNLIDWRGAGLPRIVESAVKQAAADLLPFAKHVNDHRHPAEALVAVPDPSTGLPLAPDQSLLPGSFGRLWIERWATVGSRYSRLGLALWNRWQTLWEITKRVKARLSC